MVKVMRYITVLALCLLTTQADCRGLVSGGGGGQSAPTATVTAITTSVTPCAGSSSDAPGTPWCGLGVTTVGGVPLNNPVYSLSTSSPAGFNGSIGGGSLVAGASSTASNTYTASLSVTGSNIGNAGGSFTQTGVSVVISSPLAITGVRCPPASTTVGPQGTSVGICTGVYSGGTAPPGEVITIANSLSNKFQVVSNNLQIGSSPPVAGPYSPTVTVSNGSLTPGTYPVSVTINAAAITMTTPVTCTPTLAGCAGVVGNTAGTTIGTLAATASGGTPGALSCVADSSTDSAMAGGRFQIDTSCHLKTGSVAYTAGTYTVTPSFNCANCSGGPFALAYSATVNPSGGTTLVQSRTILNNDTITHAANFWEDVGQQFAQGQVPAGDGVLWKTSGGTTIPSQQDDAVFYPDGSLKMASYTLRYPSSLVANATDAPSAYDVPSGASGHTCSATSPNTVQQQLLTHNFQMVLGVSGTVYSLYANNEQNSRASTNVRVIRSGSLTCSLYIFGELRNGSGSTATPQGQAWGAFYIDFRSDGSYRVWGQAQSCRPVNSAGVALTSCAALPLTPDANGNIFAVYDGATTLMGCDANGCTAGGNASGATTTMYAAYAIYAVDADGYPYDTAQDARKVVFGRPLPTQSNPATRALYDSKMLPWFGYTTAEINGINASPPPADSYKPFVCLKDNPNCGYAAGGDQQYIGVATTYALNAWFTSLLSTAWLNARYDRISALVAGSMPLVMRDANTGYQVNLDNYCTTSCTGMTQNVNVAWLISPSISMANAPSGHQNTTNHTPSWAAWECLGSGYRPFCDIVRDTANTVVGQYSTGYRNGLSGSNNINGHFYSAIVTMQSQLRQLAWNERDVSLAAWITPDFLADGSTPDPEKAYFTDIWDGPHGTLAAWSDSQTPPFQDNSSANPQSTLGWFFNGTTGNGFAKSNTYSSQGVGSVRHGSLYQDQYWGNEIALDLSRGWSNLNTSSALITQYVEKNYIGRFVNGCTPPAAAGYNISVEIPTRPYALDAQGLYAQTFSDVYYGDPESNYIGNASQPMRISAATSAPPITSLNVTFYNSTDAGNLSKNLLLLSNGSFYTVQPQTGGPKWVIPPETTVQSFSLSGLDATITLSGTGITGPSAIPVGVGTGYIDNGTPGVAGKTLHLVSINAGTSFLGGMKLSGTGITDGTSFAANAAPTAPGDYTVSISQLAGSSGSPVTITGMVPLNFTAYWGSQAQPAGGRQGLVPLVPPNGCSILASPTNPVPGTEYPNGGMLGVSGVTMLNSGTTTYARYAYGAVSSLAAQGVPNANLVQSYFDYTVLPTYDANPGTGLSSINWTWPTDADYVLRPQLRLKQPSFNP